MSGIVFDKLAHDESMQLDELIEQLEAELGSAEIFTACSNWSLRGGCGSFPEKIMCGRFEAFRRSPVRLMAK